VHYGGLLPQAVRLPNGDQDFPEGDLRSIVLHWTGDGYDRVYPAYHFCLTGPSDVAVHATHDLRANMRDLRNGPERPYAAHTAGRNSFAVGIAICGMRDATPQDFGPAPITAAQLDALIALCARLVRRYAIPIAAVGTHAEAALEDGYFGSAPEQRWDIARLHAAAEPLEPREATAIGDWFRERIAARV